MCVDVSVCLCVSALWPVGSGVLLGWEGYLSETCLKGVTGQNDSERVRNWGGKEAVLQSCKF